MDSIREQMDLTNEISDAISNPVGMGNMVDEVSEGVGLGMVDVFCLRHQHSTVIRVIITRPSFVFARLQLDRHLTLDTLYSSSHSLHLHYTKPH